MIIKFENYSIKGEVSLLFAKLAIFPPFYPIRMAFVRETRGRRVRDEHNINVTRNNTRCRGIVILKYMTLITETLPIFIENIERFRKEKKKKFRRPVSWRNNRRESRFMREGEGGRTGTGYGNFRVESLNR